MDGRWLESIETNKAADKLPEARGGLVIRNSSLYWPELGQARPGTLPVAFRKRYQRNGMGRRTSHVKKMTGYDYEPVIFCCSHSNTDGLLV